jgi:hypothetical protein
MTTLTNRPVSWDALREAISCCNGRRVKEAIATQLEWQQPSAEVYNFLTRTLDLVVISGKITEDLPIQISQETFE